MIHHAILTTDHRLLQNEPLSEATRNEEAQRATDAAQKLIARARAAAEKNDFSYGKLWKAYAKTTAAYPEM
jgi:hypothetical protein